MGQAGSQPTRAHTLPHHPTHHAPKVLPSLSESTRLRSTHNGAILLSGGTISQRQTGGGVAEQHTRTRTESQLRAHEAAAMRVRSGSEPDLRVGGGGGTRPLPLQPKHRKKYRAPPPPKQHHRDASSPDSSDANIKPEPLKKLRLFKTRNETKKQNGNHDLKLPTYRSTYMDFKSLDFQPDMQSFERRFWSPHKDKDQHYKYPDAQDMVQSTASLKREEHLLVKEDYRKSRIDRVSGCRAKTNKNEVNEAFKTPLLDRNFRYSERFKKDDSELPVLRREKTFDNTLLAKDYKESPKSVHESRIKAIGERLKSNKSSQPLSSQHFRKSLPSLLTKNNEEKDEFQKELKKATNRIRNELGDKIKVSESKTSQNMKTNPQKPNPTKISAQSKVKDSSLSTKHDSKMLASKKPLTRVNNIKPNTSAQLHDMKIDINENQKPVDEDAENIRLMADRGQASGKESTPEHSPTRTREPTQSNEKQNKEDKATSTPSRQFYFGMSASEGEGGEPSANNFPALAYELADFRLIERRLLGYHQYDQLDRFNARLRDNTQPKNLSSESCGSGSSLGSLGLAVRLRPTPPKRTPQSPRFSPAAAWRQLPALDLHLAKQTRVAGGAESEQCGDKSGDSGISGDNDHEPPLPHTSGSAPMAWTPQQDLGDSGSEATTPPAGHHPPPPLHTYNPGTQPFSLSLPRDHHDKGKQLQQGFNSLQKLRKSVSGALGAALGSRRFDLEHEPMLEQEQNWFLTKSAPTSLSNPLLFQPPTKTQPAEDDIKEEGSSPLSDKEELWPTGTCNSYMSWGGHVMYLPPPPQPLSSLPPIDRPVRSKSSGCMELAARAARLRSAGAGAGGEMRERSVSPPMRAVPALVRPPSTRGTGAGGGGGRRFTFQSTVRQLERRRLAERLSREAESKEQQRRTELEAMRRVEEEFQRKRAREKASIRQQLRLVSSAAAAAVTQRTTPHDKARDDPDGSPRRSRASATPPPPLRSNANTPVRSVELSEWRTETARVYRDWHAPAHDYQPVCVRMPPASPASPALPASRTATESEAFSGSPRSDNYRLEFVRGRSGRSPRSPCTPRAPRMLAAARSPSSSGSELSLPQPIRISEETAEEAAIVPTLRPADRCRHLICARAAAAATAAGAALHPLTSHTYTYTQGQYQHQH